MKMRWPGLVAILMIAVTALPTAPAAGGPGITFRVAYEGAAVLGPSTAAEECSGDLHRRLGVACTDVPARSRMLRFDVQDVSGLPVGGTYYLYDAAGNYAGAGTHCDGAIISVEGAALAIVRLEAVNGPITCAEHGKLAEGIGTKGVIEFAFR